MRSIVVFLLVLLIAVPVAAQIGESMTVEVVEVPVYVARNGKAVKGLTREDFTLKLNGEVRTIDYFDVIDRRAADPAAPQLNRRRMTMLLFDVAHTQVWALRRGQKAATAFIAQSSPNDAYAVATLTPRGIMLLVPFTTDRVNVQRAIASLRVSRAGDAFGIATTHEERAMWVADPRFEPSRERFGAMTYDMPTDRFWLPGLEQQMQAQKYRDLARQLGELAHALRPLEGQKSVILLSQPAPTAGDVFTNSELLRMHKSFRAADVILNAVDLTGLAGPFDAQSSDLLYTLALDTGGYVQSNRNNILNALRELDEMESVVYVLGFRPPPNQKPLNSIRVKVRGAGLLTSVRYRKHYSPGKPQGEAMNTMLLADVLLNDIPQNGVSVGADVQSVRDAASITVSVPGQELLAYVGDEAATADVFIYVFDKNNMVAGWGQKRVQIASGKAREHLEKNPLRIAEVMKLAPGHYVAKVLFRVRGTQATGFTRTEFDVGG